jgi:hypothetical protein
MCIPFFFICIVLATHNVYASDTDWHYFDTEVHHTSGQPATPPDERGIILELPIFGPTNASSEDDISCSSSSFEPISKRQKTASQLMSTQHGQAFEQTQQLLKEELRATKKKLHALDKKVRNLERRKPISHYTQKIHRLRKRTNNNSQAIQRLENLDLAYTLEPFRRVWQRVSSSFDQLPTQTVLDNINDFITILPRTFFTVDNLLMQSILASKSEYVYRLYKEKVEPTDVVETAEEKQQLLDTATAFLANHLQKK